MASGHHRPKPNLALKITPLPEAKFGTM
ncbi:hypothetical protein CCACVL1_19199, partial [Corchorus capsularis]